MKKKGLTKEQLEDLLAGWQKRLLLDDWGLKIKIVEFTRKDFKQSGDLEVDYKNKKAVVLVTADPFRNEESTIVHELVHLLLWDYDHFCERSFLKYCQEFEGDHDKYMDKLEDTVSKLTDILLNNKKARLLSF